MRVRIETGMDGRGWMREIRACVDLSSADEKIMAKVLTMSPFLWRGMVGKELACVWGLIPPSLLSSQAYLWLFTTRVADDHQFLLVRHSQRMVEEMLKHFPTLVGHTVVGNTRAIRWLRWLGAVFGEPDGKKIPFVIRRKNGSG